MKKSELRQIIKEELSQQNEDFISGWEQEAKKNEIAQILKSYVVDEVGAPEDYIPAFLIERITDEIYLIFS